METTKVAKKKKGKRRKPTGAKKIKPVKFDVEAAADNITVDVETGEIKLEKFMVKDYNLFVNNVKNNLIRNKKDFIYVTEGTTERVIYDNRQWTFFDREVNKGAGHHLNQFFMRDVDAYIQANKGNIRPYDTNYREQMFNLDAIERSLGKESVMMDINDCYWTTAHNLGYITEETYQRGLLGGKAWKMGRNACIGSLAKVKIIIPYKDGKPDNLHRQIVFPTEERMWVRNHIIDHIHGIFERLFNQIGDTFYMFLTDCLVTHPLKVKEVEKYLKNCGYKVKTKRIDFLAVDRSKRVVKWDDYGEEGWKEPVERYYQYNQAQIIQWRGGGGIGKFGMYL